jgi:hypothetical protein
MARGGRHGVGDGRRGGQLTRHANLQFALFDLDFAELGLAQDVGELAHELGIDRIGGAFLCCH